MLRLTSWTNHGHLPRGKWGITICNVFTSWVKTCAIMRWKQGAKRTAVTTWSLGNDGSSFTSLLSSVFTSSTSCINMMIVSVSGLDTWYFSSTDRAVLSFSQSSLSRDNSRWQHYPFDKKKQNFSCTHKSHSNAFYAITICSISQPLTSVGRRHSTRAWTAQTGRKNTKRVSTSGDK